MENVKLTEYSHGAGCGCKISPEILDSILKTTGSSLIYPNLLVGNQSKDDAAAYDLNNGMAILSTTDFFMPIVDDPFTLVRLLLLMHLAISMQWAANHLWLSLF